MTTEMDYGTFGGDSCSSGALGEHHSNCLAIEGVRKGQGEFFVGFDSRFGITGPLDEIGEFGGGKVGDGEEVTGGGCAGEGTSYSDSGGGGGGGSCGGRAEESEGRGE